MESNGNADSLCFPYRSPDRISAMSIMSEYPNEADLCTLNHLHKVCITDTTLRDAHQSLMATRLRTEDMIPLARGLDTCGFFSVEAWGGATFDTCIRFLNDDPWDRLRSLKAELKQTPIQMLLRGRILSGTATTRTMLSTNSFQRPITMAWIYSVSLMP